MEDASTGKILPVPHEMQIKRVVVTGLGVLTPIGTGVEEFWSALKAGINGIARVTHFDVSEYRSTLAGEVKNFNPSDWIEKKAAKRMDRFAQFGLAAAGMAFEDAGLDSHRFDPTRIGVIVGSGIGGCDSIQELYDDLFNKSPRNVNPFSVSKIVVNMAACGISIRYGLKGPLSAPSVACSTGSNAIGDAFRIVQRGEADIMLAGSSEACISPMAYGGFCGSRSMSTSDAPGSASRPFDRDRDGFIMGEGAGIAVLEARDHAIARGARIYAELIGYGNTSDAYHLTAPDPEGDGMARVMETALHDAGVDRTEVGYINAHGTSTPLNDRCESMAIARVFGSHAANLKISSTKSMIGHLLAAAGSVEFVATVMSIRTGQVHPTINYQNSDPDCPHDYVIGSVETVDHEIAISNSFGFGGGNACLVVRKFRE
ncbi:beta-ketoacyl-ACP synthase II [Gemmatimonadota bacterium]